MALLLADIREGIRDRYTSTSFADDRLDRFIASAVRYYSRWNPYRISSTFTTVIDKQAYDLPTDCAVVYDVLWLPLGDVLISGAEDLALYQRNILETYNQYALRYVDTLNTMEYTDAVKGEYEVRNKQLFLWPIPTSGTDTIYLAYGALHALTGSSYLTLPAEDLDVVADLALAEFLEGQQLELSLQPDWAEGLTRISYRNVTSNITEMISQMREGLESKYGGVVGVLA